MKPDHFEAFRQAATLSQVKLDADLSTLPTWIRERMDFERLENTGEAGIVKVMWARLAQTEPAVSKAAQGAVLSRENALRLRWVGSTHEMLKAISSGAISAELFAVVANFMADQLHMQACLLSIQGAGKREPWSECAAESRRASKSGF